MKKIKFGETEGLMISDKMGEIGFIHVNNIEKLPASIAPLNDAKD